MQAAASPASLRGRSGPAIARRSRTQRSISSSWEASTAAFSSAVPAAFRRALRALATSLPTASAPGPPASRISLEVSALPAFAETSPCRVSPGHRGPWRGDVGVNVSVSRGFLYRLGPPVSGEALLDPSRGLLLALYGGGADVAPRLVADDRRLELRGADALHRVLGIRSSTWMPRPTWPWPALMTLSSRVVIVRGVREVTA